VSDPAVVQVAQHVDDLARAVDFYTTKLGLPLIARFDPPGLAFLDMGGVRLMLGQGEPTSLVYLLVDDIDATWQRLRDEGVEFDDGPHLIHRDDEGTFGPVGREEWMAFLRDSEGNLVGLVERRLPS
jgi:methylmalonyl-CoA/ethylmalonyl-CoA epimerase